MCINLLLRRHKMVSLSVSQAWLLVGLCVASIHLPHEACPRGWTKVGFSASTSNCFKIYANLRKNFVQAQAYCQRQGGFLARITSGAIQNALKPSIIAAGRTSTHPTSLWIGLTDNNKNGGPWVWIGGPNLGSYKHFVGNHNPRNTPGAKDCGFVKPSDRNVAWRVDRYCNATRAVICQRPYGNTAPVVRTTTPKPVNCPRGWKSVPGKNTCIRLYVQPPKTWSDARTFCKAVQGDLVKIGDSATNNFIRREVNSHKGVYWIGLHDRNRENQFEWLDESTKTTYTYWNSHMPNNAGGNENCVTLDGNHGSKWDDKSCQSQYRYICQRAPLGGTAPPKTGPTPPSSANCGIGWEDDPNTDNCYQFGIKQLSWLDARGMCQNAGGDLASINTIQEQFYLTARTISFDSNFFWIGANDRSSERGYRWANGAPFAFINWDDKQPDNSHNSDCVALVKDTGKWDDFPCANRNGYICEKKGQTTFTPLPTTTPPVHIPAGQMWGCPRGWDNFRGSCYRVIMDDVGVNWRTANALCGAPNMGGTLVSLTDSDENKFVSAMIPHSYNGYVWIGFTDQLQEGTFSWVDGAPATFTNWNNGEPNNQRNEDCVVTRRNGRWLDYGCSNQVKVYICKKSKALMARDTAQESLGCVNGSLGFGAQCYTFVETPKNYGQAENDCRARAGRGKTGHLATLDNSQLQGFLSAEIGTQRSAFYWIGIRQYGYDYRWMSRVPVNFAYWGTNHTGSERYTCVAMQRNIPRGHWWNIPCNTNMSYICESPRTGFTTAVTKSTTPRPQNCPKGWTAPRNSSYCFMGYQMTNATDKLSWTEARTFCGRLAPGGSLVTITDSYLENWLLTNVLRGVNTTDNFWIGLNDRDTEFIYQWQDGSPFDYANWMKKQPDDLNNKEDCVQWVLPENKWMDNYCYVSFSWICQIPRGSAVPTTMPPPTGKISSQCDNSSWIEYNNNCYFLSPDDGDMSASTWFEARVTCISMGGELASITSSEENGFLTALISKTGTYDRWIGLTDLDSNTYRWSDLTPLSYISWAMNEPNDAYGGERCVEMTSDGTWNDLHCQAPIGYICKKRPGSGPPPTITSPTPPKGGCPVGFSTIPQVSKCYKVDGTRSNNRKTYDEAITACQQTASGTQLASMHSALDAKYVMTLVSNAQVWHSLSIWIGLNDRKIRNSFEWVDNSKVDFTFWAPNQPNENLKNDDPRARRDCVALWGGGKVAGLWNDRPCSNHLAYVCATEKVSTLPTSAPNSDGCPKGYQKFGSSCYKFSGDAYNWTSADGLCKADGGHLASISNRYEQAFVELVTNHLDNAEFWIGFKYDKVAAAFKWVDGWPATFTNWGHDEPDEPESLGCVTHTVDGNWHSVGCDIQFPSVCEINLGTPPPARGSGEGQCPNKSWYSYQGSCYKIESKNMKTWAGANYACGLMGANLASVHSDDEARYLTSIIGREGADLWIGLQKGQGVGFSWSDGSEAEYFYWGAGEPSDPDSNLHQDCVRASSSDGTWADVDCTDSNGYLCKKPAAGYSTQTPPVTNKPVVTNWRPPVTTRYYPPFTQPDNVPTIPQTGRHQNSPPDDNDKDSGLSGGAVAGIVIGTIAGLALLSVAGFFIFRYRQNSQTAPKTALGTANSGFDNATYSSQKGESVNFSTA